MPAWSCSRSKPFGAHVCGIGSGKIHENKWKMLTVVSATDLSKYGLNLITHFTHTKKVRMKAFKEE